MRFYDTQQARMRLDRSVVMYQGRPIMLLGPDNDWSANYIDLSSGADGSIKDVRKVKTLSLKPVPLGFCNHEGRAVYLMRMPCRRYKQGLATQNLLVCSVTGNAGSSGMSDVLLRSSNVAKTILRDYPSLESAVSRLRKGDAKSCSFHPNWALTRREGERVFRLSYKSLGMVGSYTEGAFKLKDDFDYLETALEEEVLVNVP